VVVGASVVGAAVVGGAVVAGLVVGTAVSSEAELGVPGPAVVATASLPLLAPQLACSNSDTNAAAKIAAGRAWEGVVRGAVTASTVTAL
jgi:hypothetical protein